MILNCRVQDSKCLLKTVAETKLRKFTTFFLFLFLENGEEFK